MAFKNSVTLAFATTNIDEPYYTLEVSQDEIVVHPDYTGSYPYSNNIAVIELKNNLTFGPKINKIDLVDVNYKTKTVKYVDMVILIGFDAVVFDQVLVSQRLFFVFFLPDGISAHR